MERTVIVHRVHVRRRATVEVAAAVEGLLHFHRPRCLLCKRLHIALSLVVELSEHARDVMGVVVGVVK